MEAGKRKSLRKRMRDLTRTLAKTEDPEVAKAKQSKVEDLKLLKKLVLNNTHLYGKYKAVRFVGKRYLERRKLERKLKQAQKDGEPQEIVKIQADLSYVKNYPLNYKYVSLFAAPTELTLKYRDLMRRQIKRSLSRKAQHREKVLRDEGMVQVPQETDDPFFSAEETVEDAFKQEVRAEDVEEGEESPVRQTYRRKREKTEETEPAVKRTHIKFTD